MTHILLVEDHLMVRQSLRTFLENQGFSPISEAGDGLEAVEMCRSLHPDLVLMDIHLPKMNGIEATRAIRRDCPDVRILVLTAYDEKAYRRALAGIGVDSVLLKTIGLSELVSELNRLLAGDSQVTDSNLPLIESSIKSFELTDRETEVLQCATYGWTNKMIAQHLNISDRTVQVHLQTIYQKLGVATRTEAVMSALKLGLIASTVPLMNGLGDGHTH